MLKIIILGDVHLGKGTSLGKPGIGTALNSRIVDQLNLLDWTLERAIEHCASHIFITGDVFEEPKPPYYLLNLFISWIKKCQINGVNVHIVVGNHDLLRTGNTHSSVLDLITETELENAHIYKNIDSILIENTGITLFPFRDRKSFGSVSNSEAISLLKDNLIYELSSIPFSYKKVLIGHLAIEKSIYVGDEIDDITNELFCPIDMFSGYDYVWMGHIHKPQIMSKSPYIAHIGSMDLSDFVESEHKKEIIIFDTENHNFITEYLPNRNLKAINIVIPENTLDTTSFVLKEISKHSDLKDSILKLDISLSSPELKSIDRSIIEKQVSETVFNISSINESKKKVLLKKENNDLDSKMDPISAIKKYAEIHVKEQYRSDFIELSTKIYKEFEIK